jgi:hypothetical protein
VNAHLAKPGFRFVAAFFTLLLTVALLAPAAAEESENWAPEPPKPDKWDWIQLVSGEWLKGEIIAMYDDSLEFDSDELDMLSLDFGDIISVRSGGTMRLMLLGQETTTGQLLIEGDKVQVFGDEGGEFTKSQIVTIAAGAPKESNYWSARAGLGINVRTGNTEQTDVNINARFQRRTAKNRINIDYLGAYSQVEGLIDPAAPTLGTESRQSAHNHRASAGWDKFISDRFYVSPIFAEWFRDPFQNIAARWTVGVGAGYDIIDTAKTGLSITGGPAYQTNKFNSVEAGQSDSENTPAFVFSTNFDKELNKRIDIIWTYRIQIVNEESGSYNHHMLTSFETELTKLLDFDISWVWDRIKDPRPDANGVVPQQDDHKYIVALSFDW